MLHVCHVQYVTHATRSSHPASGGDTAPPPGPPPVLTTDLSFRRHAASKGILVAMVCTFFEAFNVPVFWPILVMYHHEEADKGKAQVLLCRETACRVRSSEPGFSQTLGLCTPCSLCSLVGMCACHWHESQPPCLVRVQGRALSTASSHTVRSGASSGDSQAPGRAV